MFKHPQFSTSLTLKTFISVLKAGFKTGYLLMRDVTYCKTKKRVIGLQFDALLWTK